MRFIDTLLAFILIGSASCYLTQLLSQADISIDSTGRYQGIVVYVGHREGPSDSSTYLITAQNLLTAVSRSLYDSLGVQFGNISILLPSSWTGVDADDESSDYRPEDASIIIREGGSATLASTHHVLGCGQPALFMNIDKQLILDSAATQSQFHDGSRLLYHSWLSGRYGVFEEYPLLDSVIDIDTQRFYHSSSNTISAVRCSEKLKTSTSCQITEDEEYADVNRQTSLPEESCSFSVINPEKPAPSIMSHYKLPNVFHTCNSSTHNYEAPNRHNRLCQGQSVQEVISQHTDFSDTKVDAKEPFTAPSFSIHKERDSRTVVFILDVSKSMEGERLLLATTIIKLLLTQVLEDGVKVAIVIFNGEGRVVFPYSDSEETLELNSDETRSRAAESLTNLTAVGYTCIGCGIEKAFSQLKRPNGAFFLLLTDGKDNKNEEKLKYTFRQSTAENVFIDIILLTAYADDIRIKSLANEIGSKIYQSGDDPLSVIDAFGSLTSRRQKVEQQAIQIFADQYPVDRDDEIDGYFKLEQAYRHHASVYIYWRVLSQSCNLTFTLAVDRSVITQKTINSIQSDIWVFNIGDENMPSASKYEYRVTNRGPQCVFTIKVNSVPNTEQQLKREVQETGLQPLRMTLLVHGLSNFTITPGVPIPTVSVHAVIPPGSVPSTPTYVQASVYYQSLVSNLTITFPISLHDDGSSAADIIPGDGIYSQFFSNYQSENGTYAVSVQVEGLDYMRYDSVGFFIANFTDFVKNVSVLLPPSRIVDLQVVEVQQTEITLTFTAPGADYAIGVVTTYTIWSSHSLSDLRHESKTSASIYGQQMEVKGIEPGERVLLYMAIPDTHLGMNRTLWIGVTAVDEFGVEGDLSNIVSALYIDRSEDRLILTLTLSAVSALTVMCCIIAALIIHKRRVKAAESCKDEEAVSAYVDPDVGFHDLKSYETMTLDAQIYQTYRSKPLAHTAHSPTRHSLKQLMSRTQRWSRGQHKKTTAVTISPKLNTDEPVSTVKAKEMRGDEAKGEKIAQAMIDSLSPTRQ